jgi:hypothetical protein
MNFLEKAVDCWQQGKSTADNKAQSPAEPAPKSPR